MKIGIDIDNTICKTNMISEKLYKKYNKGDFKSLSKIEQYEFSALHEDEIFDFCTLNSNVSYIINKLIDEKNEIYIITARSNKRVNNIENRTINYLKKNNIRYNGIYFGYDKKYDIYKNLNLDIMLDDDFSVYDEITKNGGNAVLFKGNLNENKKGIKVSSFKEFYEYIERKK